jgi:hypothetical protein
MKNRIYQLLFAFLILSQSLFIFHVKANDVCSDVAIIFARGSGQNLEHKYLDNPYDGDYFGLAEPQSFIFFEEIEKRISGLSVERISLHNFGGKYNQYGYEAVDAVDGFTSKPNHRSDVYNRYYESVADGAEELAWFLEDRLTSCPFQQIIVGGYSQGAHVVGDALFKLKPNLRPRIAYVALFGDPKFNPRTSAIPPIIGPWVRGNASSLQTGLLLARKNYLPDEIVYKTSWCDIADPICANYSFANTPIGAIYEQFVNKTHQEVYQNRWIPQAANEIAQAIKDRTPSLAGNIQTATWVNKNDKLYQTDLAIVLDVSGSMISEIRNIKKKLDGFVTGLFNSYWDTRIALVGFSDTDYLSPYVVRVLSDFTYSKEPIRANISDISPKANAGGDDPEAQIAGLMTAMDNLSWRKDAQKKILVISDAAPKSPDPIYGAWTKEQIAQKALEMDPVSISVFNPPRLTSWQKLIDLYANYFSAATNGVRTTGSFSYLPEEVLQVTNTMNALPVAAIEGPATGYMNEPLALSGGGSYDPDSAIISYSWDCNNDGVWEAADLTQPIYECIFANPYNGFVVLEVTSADGGSAKATLVVDITERSEPVPVAPEAPIASATRNSGGYITVSWVNNYADDVIVRILDASDNVLGVFGNNTPSSIFQVQDLEMIYLEAGNGAGWSEKTKLTISPIPSNESDQSGNIYELDKKQPQPTPTPTPTPMQDYVYYPSDAQNAPAELPLTSIAGVSDKPANQPNEPKNTEESFVTSDSNNLDTYLWLIGGLILMTGVTLITHRSHKNKF